MLNQKSNLLKTEALTQLESDVLDCFVFFHADDRLLALSTFPVLCSLHCECLHVESFY